MQSNDKFLNNCFLDLEKRQSAQVKLRLMKKNWWMHKSQELQEAADQKDMKRFFEGLKSVYVPRNSGSAPVRSKDVSILLSDRGQILKRWAEHLRPC